MKIKEIRQQMGMSQREFAEYFGIPVRTIQEWEQERRQPAPYLSELLERIMDSERRRKKLKEVPQDSIFNTEGGGRKKNIIRCEVTCGCCGRIASSSGFYSLERIKKIKEETKEWLEDEWYGALCPECRRNQSAR